MSRVAPISYHNLKALCRNGFSSEEVRSYWWPVLPTLRKDENVEEYPNIAEEAKRLAKIVKLDIDVEVENEETKLRLVMAAIGTAMSSKDGVKEYVLVQGLMKIICQHVPSFGVCHLIGCDVTSKSNKYLALTNTGHRSRLFAFREYLMKFMPRTYDVLHRIGALHDRFLNLMFVNLFVSLLPRDLHLRMMDAYLLEGWRVLVRYGLALIRAYKSEIKSGAFNSGEHFWNFVEAQALESTNVSRFENLPEVAFSLPQTAIQLILRGIVVSSSNLTTAVNRGSAAAADTREDPELKLFIPVYAGESEKAAKRMSLVGTACSSNHDSSSANLPAGLAIGSTKDATVWNMDSNKGDSSLKVQSGAASKEYLPPRDLVIALSQKSTILRNTSNAEYLLTILPDLIKYRGLEVAYSSSEHGFDLGTLYAKAQGLEQCLLLIETVPHSATSNQGQIIGAYLSTTMLPVSSRVKGSGMSFVFSVSHQQKWTWNEPAVGASAKLDAACRQFFVCTQSHISVGASANECTNAIRIDEHLKYCYSGVTDTYNSPSLLEMPNGQQNIEIFNVEVLVPEGEISNAIRKGTRSAK